MFHLHLRYTSKDGMASCTDPVLYAARMGRYSKRPDKVRVTMFFNMPTFANSDATFIDFWIAAEGPTSRQNARTSVGLEAAIPKTLSESEQNDLVKEFVTVASFRSADVPGHAVPATASVHEGHGRNPHFHLSLSTSMNDWLERPHDRWFRRYNPVDPERGGARGSRFIENKNWVFMIRKLWADMANAALLKAGQSASLDHRSNAARGVSLTPSIHLGPAVAYVARNGGASLRSARLEAIQEDNETQEALEASAAKGRLDLESLRLRLVQWEMRLPRWHDARRKRWQQLLVEHPLLQREELGKVATVTVIDANGANWRSIELAHRKHSAQSFGLAIGHGWESVKTDRGLWQIDPKSGDAVMIDHDYIATDGSTIAAFEVVATAASVLGYAKPVVYVQPAALSTFQGVLDRLGLGWGLNVVGPKSRQAGAFTRFGR